MDFHVAGAFEFFINHIVHTAAGFNQSGTDDGERAAFFQVAGCAENTFRALQGVGVYAAGKHFTGCRNHGVVGAGQTRNGVKQNNDVFLAFSQALGFFDDHFSNLNMASSRFVEGGSNDFAFNGAFHFCHFFRTFVDQKDHQDDVRIVSGNRVSDMLH